MRKVQQLGQSTFRLGVTEASHDCALGSAGRPSNGSFHLKGTSSSLYNQNRQLGSWLGEAGQSVAKQTEARNPRRPECSQS